MRSCNCKSVVVMGVLVLLVSLAATVSAAVDCTTVTALVSACASFVTYGTPDPFPGSACCDAVKGINNLSFSFEDRKSVCRCLMGLITTYNPNATAVATLPGFCGIFLGFTIDPNTDCNNIP